MKRILLLSVLSCLVLLSWAVPAVPYPVLIKDADGVEQMVYLRGDESFSYYTTPAGEVLQLSGGKLVSADDSFLAQAGSAMRKAPAAVKLNNGFPKSGTVRVPVFLCCFPDRSFTVSDPVAAFSAMLNEEGYSANNAIGSVHDYYYQSSCGKLNLIFDVFGPFCMPNNEEYYGGNSGNSHQRNMSELVSELISQAAQAGADFSLYDANSDGVVDNVSIFFAGHNEAEGGKETTIWPHQSKVSNAPSYNGKSFSSYLITSELRGNLGQNMAGIGTYCHEFGHVLDLPDLYNTSNNTSDEQIYTIGSWDLMCAGSYNNNGRTPPLLSAFERFMMGWQTPVQISDAGTYRLDPLSKGGEAYLLASSAHNMNASSPSPTEYFLVENRQQTGWEATDGCLPGHGLLISHVTFNSSNWRSNNFNNDTPLGVDIVEAYNPNPTAATPTDTYPGTKGVTAMTPVLNSGDSLKSLRLHNIYERADGVVSFQLGDVQGAGFSFEPSVPDTFVTTFEGRVYEYFPQQITITGKGIPTATVSVGFSNNLFELQADSVWLGVGNAFTDSVGPDGSYERTFTVRFRPKRKSCTVSTSVMLVFSADSMLFNQCSLMGVAPRPNYITQPDSLQASSVTSSSVRVSWKEEQDAELYYVKAYSLSAEGEPELAAEKEVVAPDDHVYLFGLQANTAYYVLVQAYEEKGCSAFLTTASDTLRFSTCIDTDTRVALPIVQKPDGSCLLYLPAEAPEGMIVYIYSADGAQIASTTVAEGSRQVALPAERLIRQNLYLVKYASGDRIRRKDYWSKFVYYGLR